MERIKYITLLLLITFSKAYPAATDTSLQLQAVKTIPGSYTNFYIDNLNNYYLLSSTNQVKKLNSNGDSVAAFNDVRRYGNIYALDVTNPLKPLVYYKDFATIVITDRFLNVVNRVDLRSLNITQANAIALSYDNNIWIYDELEAKLKKIDDKGNLLFQSSDFRLLFTDVPHPSKIIDSDGQLYLYDNKTGWYIFDYYGALKQKLSFINWSDVNVQNNVLTGRDSSVFYSCFPKQLQFNSIKTNINLSAAIKVQQQRDKIYVLTKEALLLYTL